MPLDMSYVRNAAAAIEKEKSESGRRDIKNYEYVVGQNRGRLLPPYPGSGELAIHIWHHFALPAPFKHAFCWENMFPGRGIQCPYCTVLKNLNSKGIECWRQGAADIPQTNWINRVALNQFKQPIQSWDQHPGVQIIDLNVATFNYFINIASQTGCDLTSTGDGWDCLINFDGKKQKEPAVFPGAPTPLCENPEVAKLWLSQMYDLRKFHKMPDWATQDGKIAWEKLCQGARELERSYLAGASNGGVVAGAPPVGQWPQASLVGSAPPAGQWPQAPGSAPQPVFTQPTAPPPYHQPQAPPPTLAPPPLPPPPQFANPTAMAGDVPFAGPPAPSAPQPAQPQAPALSAPPTAAYQPPSVLPASTQTGAPPWEAPAQPSGFPPQPPNLGVQSTASSTPINQTSADGKPICYGHSRLDMTVQYGKNAGSDAQIKGGWSDDMAVVMYRCSMCPYELACSAKAKAEHPNDYVKDANGAYVTIVPVTTFPN